MIKALLKQSPRVERLARRLISIYPLSARLGPPFWKWYAFLQESESWTEEELRAFQFERLRELLQRLAASSPFYAHRLAGVSVSQLRDLDGFQKAVPPLSRMEFAANYPDIRSRDFSRRRVTERSTSGTTGNALQFFDTVENGQREWASICHQWKRVGYDPVRSRRAEFRGLTRAGSLFDEYPEQNMVRFSILHLQAASLGAMANVITAQRLRFFHGYPSALYLLARELLRSGLRFPQPEAILLASEMVYAFQLEQIQAAFPGARLFAHYGCAEGTVLAGWCEHRRAYHILPQYSLVETDPATGEIIGTNFHNAVNGFVRYRMTDVACGVEASACPACRRPYTPVFNELDGRSEDFLFSREYGWIAPAIVTYPLKHLHHIREIQFHQQDPDCITANVVARPDADPDAVAAEMKTVEAGLRELIGPATRFEAHRVADISRGPSGKFKWITSNLDPRNGTPP